MIPVVATKNKECLITTSLLKNAAQELIYLHVIIQLQVLFSGKNSQGVNTERATNTKKRKKAEGKRAEKDTRQPQILSDALQDYSTLMFLWVDYDAWNWNVGKIHEQGWMFKPSVSTIVTSFESASVLYWYSNINNIAIIWVKSSFSLVQLSKCKTKTIVICMVLQGQGNTFFFLNINNLFLCNSTLFSVCTKVQLVSTRTIPLMFGVVRGMMFSQCRGWLEGNKFLHDCIFNLTL